MMILGYDITSIGLESTVNKLVIIRVGSYKTQMIVHLNHLGIGEAERTATRKRHQQTVGVKDNVHYCVYGVRMC